MHNCDECFGNLYRPNTEEEPEHPDYPKDLYFRLHFCPRSVERAAAGSAGRRSKTPAH
jgi:hypothetical protein